MTLEYIHIDDASEILTCVDTRSINRAIERLLKFCNNDEVKQNQSIISIDTNKVLDVCEELGNIIVDKYSNIIPFNKADINRAITVLKSSTKNNNSNQQYYFLSIRLSKDRFNSVGQLLLDIIKSQLPSNCLFDFDILTGSEYNSDIVELELYYVDTHEAKVIDYAIPHSVKSIKHVIKSCLSDKILSNSELHENDVRNNFRSLCITINTTKNIIEILSGEDYIKKLINGYEYNVYLRYAESDNDCTTISIQY